MRFDEHWYQPGDVIEIKMPHPFKNKKALVIEQTTEYYKVIQL